jgi:hypothetical protein
MTSPERKRALTLGVGGAVLFALVVFAAWVRPFADLDFAWQVRTGEQIVHSGSLHVKDQFSYTIAGEQLPDFEWLWEVFLWGVWSIFGYAGLHILKVLCVITPLLLVGRRLRREGVGWHAVYLSLTVAVLALMPTWNLRPFYCTTIGLLLLSGWLHDHCAGRRPLPWYLPLLMLIWANTHPGVITGQGLLAGAIGWEWLNRWFRLNPPLDRAACRRLTFIGGFGLLATLICPGPVERLQYTFNPDLAHPIMRGFVEMMPLHWHAAQPPYLAGLIYVVAVLVFATIVLRVRAYRLWEIALLAGLAFLASYAYRSAPDFLLVMLAVGVPHVVALYRQAAPIRVPAVLWRMERSAKRVFSSPAFRFQPAWAVILLLLLPLVSFLPRSHGKDWPEAALDFIEREKIRGNFFGNPNHGAYLLWRLGPEDVRCYVDTRGFFFPPEVLMDCQRVMTCADDWRERLGRVIDRRTDWFLLETQGPGGALWRAMEGKVTPRYLDDGVVLVSIIEVRKWRDLYVTDQSQTSLR